MSEKSNNDEKVDVPSAPDGGWGWVVTISSFVISLLVDGICFTFGLFLPQFLDHFHGSKGKTALLGSVMNGMYLSFETDIEGVLGLSTGAINNDNNTCKNQQGSKIASNSEANCFKDRLISCSNCDEKFQTNSRMRFTCFGPIASAFVNKFGARKVAVFGSIMAATGLFLCTFSTNLDLMIFLYGGIAGGGFGLAYLPAIIMVGYYFEKKRAFATGIAVCGSGIGGFVFAPLCVYLINEYSWQGALWILSGIVLNGVIFSCFYRPLPKRQSSRQLCCEDKNGLQSDNNDQSSLLLKKIKTDLEVECPIYRCKSVEMKTCQNGKQLNGLERLTRSQDFYFEKTNSSHLKHRHVETLNPLARKDIFYSGSLHHIPEYITSKNKCEYLEKVTIKETDHKDDTNACIDLFKSVLSAFDFNLLKSPTFVVYGISCFLCMFGFFIPFNFLPDYAKEVGLSSGQQALLISMIGIANTVARLAVGFVSDRSWADCLLINNIALIIAGGTTAFVPFVSQYGILITYSILFGTGIAAFVSLRSIIMVELMGIEKLSSSFGLVVLCQGLSSFIGPPVTGSLADITGDYSITFYMAGASLTLAGIICFPLRRISRWEKAKDQRINEISVQENGHCIQEVKTLLEDA